MLYSHGNTNDKPCLYLLIKMAARMNPKMYAIVQGAGYDSFEIHARIWRTFEIHPLIQFREDAVILRVFEYCWVSIIGMIHLVIVSVLPDQHWMDRLRPLNSLQDNLFSVGVTDNYIR